MRAGDEDGKPVVTFSADHVQALLRACRREMTRTNVSRDRAIIALLLDTCLRPAELVRLTVDQVVLGSVRRRTARESWLTVGTRRFRLSGLARRCLARHLETRGESDSDALFLGSDGKPLTPGGVTGMLTQLAARVERDHPGMFTGIPVTASTFRATFAVEFLQSGGTTSDLAALLSRTSGVTLHNYWRAARQRRR